MSRISSLMLYITILTIGSIYAELPGYDLLLFEENGLEMEMHATSPTPSTRPAGDRQIICLLIPDSDNDRICMFDPSSGAFLGDFIIDDTSSTPQYDFQTPLNAIQGPGPDANIFVSDQVSDAVYVFDPAYGNYLYTYIDSSDGLNNITIYANDTTGNLDNSSMVYFTVDTTKPNLTLNLPIENYNTSNVNITFNFI